MRNGVFNLRKKGCSREMRVGVQHDFSHLKWWGRVGTLYKLCHPADNAI